MALPFKSIALFSGVLLAAGLFTASSLSMTATMVSSAAASAPVAAKPLKPSYIARMPVVSAEALDVARSVPVVVKAPVAPSLPPALEQAVAEIEAAPAFSHRVAVSGANVRSGPQKSAPQVFTLREGSWVNIADNVRGWVKVTDETGRGGWVYGQLLQPATTEMAALD
jgi:uncharacterized protein YgiM (DUF1202 family)